MVDDNEELIEEGEEHIPDQKIAIPSTSQDNALMDRGGDEGGEGWLMSYADMMTLIACFFILMMAFANYDPPAFSKNMEEVSKHFSGKEQMMEAMGKMEELAEEIKRNDKIKDMVKVKMDTKKVEITFSGSTLFDSGSADIKGDVRDSVDIMIDIIQKKDPQFRILLEGHTDITPVRNSSKYRTNWELSGARAARIIERFELFGFNPKQLVAVGYGSTRPEVPNLDDLGNPIIENLKQNRRVVIKVLEPISKYGREKLGLGAFFENNDIVRDEEIDKIPSQGGEGTAPEAQEGEAGPDAGADVQQPASDPVQNSGAVEASAADDV